MTKVETLTAYSCKFSYLQRNNPLIEEQREAVKEGKKPEYTFSDFIEKYEKYTENLAIGENTDRAILLTGDKISMREKEGTKIWHIMPGAGKQGKPVVVIKRQTGKKYNFDSDSAALYAYHIFVYENGDTIVAIFHRQNGSGCKSVFLETANKALKSVGLKLDMDLIVPPFNEIQGGSPTRMTLQFTRENNSSDIADHMKVSKKKCIIRDLGLNLEASENRKILGIIQKMQLKRINKEDAFSQIKAELPNSEEYNDAEIRLKIGNQAKNVKWNDFEHIMGNYDITQKLYEGYRATQNFAEVLIELADEYYQKIIESEVI